MTTQRMQHDPWVMWLTSLFVFVACAVFTFAIIRHRRVLHNTPVPEAAVDDAQPGAPIAGEFNVVRVADGDSIVLIGTDGLEISVRLKGIDAPELGQPYGLEAKQALQTILNPGTVRLSQPKKGKYGRYVANVYLDDTWVNQTMVTEGHAWCDQVTSFDRTLYSAQQQAKAQAKGLWASPTPVPPWIWRAERK